jgi:hypothetical protein
VTIPLRVGNTKRNRLPIQGRLGSPLASPPTMRMVPGKTAPGTDASVSHRRSGSAPCPAYLMFTSPVIGPQNLLLEATESVTCPLSSVEAFAVSFRSTLMLGSRGFPIWEAASKARVIYLAMPCKPITSRLHSLRSLWTVDCGLWAGRVVRGGRSGDAGPACASCPRVQAGRLISRPCFTRRPAHPRPQTHRRGQPLQSEALYAKNVWKSPTPGVRLIRWPLYVVYFMRPRSAFPIPPPRPRTNAFRRRGTDSAHVHLAALWRNSVLTVLTHVLTPIRSDPLCTRRSAYFDQLRSNPVVTVGFHRAKARAATQVPAEFLKV